MQAIQVHYRHASATARAFCAGGSVVLPVDDIRKEAILVAKALMTKLNWTGELVEGQLPNGDYVFTIAQVDTTTVRFYQIFSGNNDRDGNPYRLVLLYNAKGSVVKVLEYRQSMVDTNIQMIYKATALYGAVHLTPAEYNEIRECFAELVELR